MQQKQLSREAATNHAVEALKLIPHNRAYALTEDSARALGAMAQAWLDARDSFSREELAREIMEPLTKVPNLNLRQNRPAPPNEMPKPWSDPVTGQPAKNPFSDPIDLTSASELRRRDPALAAHLQLVKDGPTYATLAKIKDDAEAAEKLRALPYGEKEHAANPYTGSNLTAKSDFTKEHENEPWLIQFYRAEAERAVTIHFEGSGNLTARMQVLKAAPHLRQFLSDAEDVYRQWLAEDLHSASEAQRAAEERVRVLKMETGTARKVATR